MARKLFYFGTAEQMSWVPCPNSGMIANNVKWRAGGTLLSGGGWGRSSSTGHMEYNMAWPVMSHEDAASLTDYFNGVYGEPPFYFLDPMIINRNILPSWLASPQLQALDAPTMYPGITPTLGPWSTVSNGYPTRSAQYTLGVNQTGTAFSFPVPPGYTLRFGWHGTATGTAKIRLIGGSASVDTTPISATGSTTRVNSVMTRDATFGVVYLQIIGGASGGTLDLRGMTAVVLPTADASPTGNFISGQGNLGVRLRDEPQITAYSTAIPNANVGVTANFIETGAWL
jgi:hypothetical protein